MLRPLALLPPLVPLVPAPLAPPPLPHSDRRPGLARPSSLLALVALVALILVTRVPLLVMAKSFMRPSCTAPNHHASNSSIIRLWPNSLWPYIRLKHTYGIYFTTCEKSNSAAEIISVNLLNHSEPHNQGVVSDHIVGTSNGVQLRRIVYINPEDGVTYTYLTNDFTLPAYQIELLYKHRWHQLRAHPGHPADPTIHPVGQGSPLPRGSLE